METIVCRFCLDKFSVESTGEYQCPHCNQKQLVQLDASPAQEGDTLRQDQSPFSTAVQPPLERRRFGPTPWEDRGRLGFFEGFKETLINSLKEPAKFYRTLEADGSLGNALLYAIIISTVVALLSFLIGLGIQIPLGFFDSTGSQSTGVMKYFFVGNKSGLTMVLFMPFYVVFSIFIYSMLVHLCLILLGGAKESFFATVRVISYAQGALIFSIIPCVGSLIATVWQIVMVVSGLGEVHETNTGKAVIAALMPIMVCCGLAILGILVMFSVFGGFDFLENLMKNY